MAQSIDISAALAASFRLRLQRITRSMIGVPYFDPPICN